MSDVLWGVIIGGIIGNVTGIITLIISHYKWKREFKLNYLKDERQRLEKLYNEIYDPITKTLYSGMVNPQVKGKLLISLPNVVSKKITEYVDQSYNADEPKKRELTTAIGTAMRESLNDIENEIKKLVSI